jgi:hypothetical protein
MIMYFPQIGMLFNFPHFAFSKNCQIATNMIDGGNQHKTNTAHEHLILLRFDPGPI